MSHEVLGKTLIVLVISMTGLSCSKEKPEPTGTGGVKASSEESPATAAAGNEKLDSGKLLEMAVAEAKRRDPGARLVGADYKRGDRKLLFKSADFTFNSPAAKARGERKSSFRVMLRRGKVHDVRELPFYWIESPPDPRPESAFRAAMQAGFAAWWDAHPKAWIYLKLTGRAQFGDPGPDSSPMMWRIMGSGPGVNEDYKLYLDAKTLSKIGEKTNRHNMDQKQVDQSLKEAQKILDKKK